MIEETAQVVEVKDQQLLLQTQRQSACQACSVKSGCGTSVLSNVVGTRSSQFLVDKTLDLQVGDKVLVAVDENALVQGSLLIYFMPLIFMMSAGILVDYIFAAQGLTILATFVGFFLALFVVRFLFAAKHFKNKIQPHLIRQVY